MRTRPYRRPMSDVTIYWVSVASGIVAIICLTFTVIALLLEMI